MQSEDAREQAIEHGNRAWRAAALNAKPAGRVLAAEEITTVVIDALADAGLLAFDAGDKVSPSPKSAQTTPVDDERIPRQAQPLQPPTNGRLFIGPADAEIIGLVDGTPVTADEDGAGRMNEITEHVTDVRLDAPEDRP